MQMLAAASPRHGKHLRKVFVCGATPALDVLRIMACTCSPSPSAQSGSLVQKTSAQAPEGLDARVCAQRFTHS